MLIGSDVIGLTVLANQPDTTNIFTGGFWSQICREDDTVEWNVIPKDTNGYSECD